jgi:hypothetical protein
MKQEIQITVPNDYSAITLSKYLRLHADLETYKDNPEALDAVMFYHLCDISPDVVNALPVETYNNIKAKLLAFINTQEFPLQRILTIDGVKYGFEPNLGNMSYAAYVDISKFQNISIDNNISKILSILYRPVTKQSGALYEIKRYSADEVNSKIWDDVSMDVVFGAYFFFMNLQKDLLHSIQKSLMVQAELPPSIKSILETSGALIHQL